MSKYNENFYTKINDKYKKIKILNIYYILGRIKIRMLNVKNKSKVSLL